MESIKKMKLWLLITEILRHRYTTNFVKLTQSRQLSRYTR